MKSHLKSLYYGFPLYSEVINGPSASLTKLKRTKRGRLIEERWVGSDRELFEVNKREREKVDKTIMISDAVARTKNYRTLSPTPGHRFYQSPEILFEE